MLVILSGVSGAGKDTIKRELIKNMEGVDTIPSYTSRAKRETDIEGQYYYITKEEFEEKIKAGEFYEYNLHHSNYYGTSRKVIDEKLASGKVIIKDIDVNGTENLVKCLGNQTKIITIFLKVPLKELKRRIQERDKNITVEQIEERLGRSEYEESKMVSYDYVIKNNDLEKTLNIIEKIIEEELKSKKLEF
jgi:guanylate kinase